MHLDPKGLEAAELELSDVLAAWTYIMPSDGIDRVIRSYLSATIPADAAELVERWKHRGIAAEATLAMKAREAAKGHDWVVAHEVIQCDEIVATASLIQSQAARIAALEMGLGAMADEYIDYVEADMGRELRNGDLPPAWHRARALLNRRAEG